MRSYIVEENHIGSAECNNLRYRQIHRRTFCYKIKRYVKSAFKLNDMRRLMHTSNKIGKGSREGGDIALVPKVNNNVFLFVGLTTLKILVVF